MTTELSVSVIIPSFNGQKYIFETLESIRKQTIVPDEVVVSDDGSYDLTLEKVAQFEKSFNKLTVVEGPRDGISQNYLSAMAAATGDIVIVGDQDDPWRRERVEKILDCFRRGAQVSLVSTDSELVNADLVSLGSTLRGGADDSRRLARQVDEDDLIEYLKGLRLDAHTLAFKASLKPLIVAPKFANKANIWFEEKVAIAALSVGKLVYLPDALTLYRQHDGQHTRRSAKVQRVVREQDSRRHRLSILLEILDENQSTRLFDDQESERRKNVLRDYLDLSEHRSATRPKFATSLDSFLAGKYHRFCRHPILSFCKDCMKTIKFI